MISELILVGFSQVTGFIELPGCSRVVAVSRDQTASVIEVETREVLKVVFGGVLELINVSVVSSIFHVTMVCCLFSFVHLLS